MGGSLTDTRRNFSAGDSAKGNRLSLHKKVQRPPNRFILAPPPPSGKIDPGNCGRQSHRFRQLFSLRRIEAQVL